MKFRSIFWILTVFLLMFFASFCNAEIYETDEPEREQVQKQTAESYTFTFTAEKANTPEQIADFEHRQRYSKTEKGFITNYKSPTKISDNFVWQQLRYRQLKGYIFTTSEKSISKALPYFHYYSSYGLANWCA